MYYAYHTITMTSPMQITVQHDVYMYLLGTSMLYYICMWCSYTVHVHYYIILQCLKHESVVRRDPRWETILISVCDAVALLCKGSPENQQCWRRIGGGAALFYVLGDGDLRNTRLRGSGRDAVEGCADGWGAAEDAMNIVLL